MTNKEEDQDVKAEIELPAGDGAKPSGSKRVEDRGSERLQDREHDSQAGLSVSFGPTSMVQTEGDYESADDRESSVVFPMAFYDPMTMQVMKDPVVDRDGNSIEKPAKAPDTGVYYPNRALKSIIQRQVELASPSFVGSLRRIDDAVWKSWSKLVDNSLIGGSPKPLPDGFYCPISAEVMVDPVISPDGHTFERMAIEHWVRANGTNPISRDPLPLNSLRRNNNLYDLIQLEKNKLDSARHPSIIRWKESTAETSRRDDFLYEDEETPQETPQVESMPTTYGEIASLQRRQRQVRNNSIMFVLLCTAMVLLFVLPYGAALLLYIVALFICNKLCEPTDSETTN
jgi:U-box domain